MEDDVQNINREIKEFYSNLYNDVNIVEEKIQDFLEDIEIPKLAPDIRNSCEVN